MANSKKIRQLRKLPYFLLLPLHREVAEFVDCPAGQHITNRDKGPAPPVGYNAQLLAPQSVQASTSAERWLREGVQLQTYALPLLVQSVEVGRNTRRADRCNPYILVSHLLGKGHREGL